MSQSDQVCVSCCGVMRYHPQAVMTCRQQRVLCLPGHALGTVYCQRQTDS